MQWSAREGGENAERAEPSREFEIITYWTRPYDDPTPVDIYLHTDAGGRPHPYLLFGSVTNHGGSTHRATVAAAWRDENGRVLWTSEVDATCIAGRFDTGAACDFLFVVDDPGVAPESESASVVLWAVGS